MGILVGVLMGSYGVLIVVQIGTLMAVLIGVQIGAGMGVGMGVGMVLVCLARLEASFLISHTPR